MKTKAYQTLTLCLILAFSTVLFSNCTDENDSTRVEITVNSLSFIPTPGETVYLFREPTTHSKGQNPKDAEKSVVTNKKGVAVFELNNVSELKWFSKETTLYFTVFKVKDENEAYEVAGTVGITVTKGKKAEGTINLKL